MHLDLIRDYALSAGLSPYNWDRFNHVLHGLYEVSPFTHEHTLRVGLYAHNLAAHEGSRDLLLPLLGGVGHDVGKQLIPPNLLHTNSITDPEFETIKDHTVLGYHLLKEHFPLPALVAGLHHRLRHDGYGLTLEVLDNLHPSIQRSVLDTTRLVMLCDFFDAMRTRNSDKGWLKDPNNQDEQKDLMLRFFPEAPDRIAWLFSNPI